MPITQERIVRVILAGDDFAQAWTRATRLAQELRAGLTLGTHSPQEAFDALASFLHYSSLRQPEDSRTALEVEKAHFKREGRRNVKRARAMALQRGTALPAQDHRPLEALREKPASPQIIKEAYQRLPAPSEMDELLALQAEDPDEPGPEDDAVAPPEDT